MFKEIIKKAKKINYMHYIATAITIVFVAVAVFVFPNGIIRIWESLKDLFWSVLYYVKELFDLNIAAVPTVNNYSSVPWTPIWNLPATWEAFKVSWGAYWKLFISGDNIVAYFTSIGEGGRFVSQLLLLVVAPLILVLYMLFQKYLNKHNNDYCKDSKPVVWCKNFSEKVYRPIKKWIKSFINFLSENGKYIKMWLLIWAYNFNLITIVIEFFAFYFYIVISFDFLNIYRQVYKLFCDISVPIAFIPVPAWLVIGYLVFDKIRKNIGYAVLRHHEACNCGFINERPIVSMACGTMGKKKTTMITDMTLLQEKMFREKALELMLENDLKFPNFPWIRLEKWIQWAMEEHVVFSLATIRKSIKHFKYCYEAAIENPDWHSSIRKHLYKRYSLPYSNLMFGYDYEKYGILYNDKLKMVSIWECMEKYAQCYYVYILKSTLIVSNYSVRTDTVVADLGNLPLRDNDFYRRNAEFIDKLSRYSNIIDFNAMRLGKKLGDTDDPKKDSFEFGIVGFTEGGKERKNNLQLQELKKNTDVANQKNDGFNDWLKMIRHSGTIEFFPFVKVFTDEQRPESWGADGRDLCEIIHIKDGGKTKLAMPFFALTELFYGIVYDKFVSLYLKYRHVRADTTLLMYLFKKAVSKLQSYYKGIYNTFGYCKMSVQVESGTQDGELSDKAYYLDNKRIYADRFSTDCFSEFFTTKSLRSEVGFDDLEEYKTSKATFEELQKQNSYFIADLMNKQENDK